MTSLSVAASLPQFCTVCRGRRSIVAVSLLDFPTHARVACPHCVGVYDKQVEIPDLPYRTDIPRGAA